MSMMLEVCLCTLCKPNAPRRPQEGVQSPRTGIKDNCELSCEYWEPIPSALEEQPMVLTPESSLQLFLGSFLKVLSGRKEQAPGA